jgi:hypothetical protein
VSDAALVSAKLLNANQIDAKRGLWMRRHVDQATTSKLSTFALEVAAANSSVVIRSTAVRNSVTRVPAVHAGKPSSTNSAVTADAQYFSLLYPAVRSRPHAASRASVPKTVVILRWVTTATETKKAARNAHF